MIENHRLPFRSAKQNLEKRTIALRRETGDRFAG